VRRIDQPRDTYALDRLTAYMKDAGRSLNREIRDATGERVWVHPVVVLWGLNHRRVGDALHATSSCAAKAGTCRRSVREQTSVGDYGAW
jgi:hypothetical protein